MPNRRRPGNGGERAPVSETGNDARLVTGRSPFPVPWRLAGYYAAVFLAIGLFMPYWPLWLESRGLDAAEIGIVLALTTWSKVVATPLASGMADRLGRRRPVMLTLAVCTVAAFCFYAAADTFGTLALAALMLGACFPPLIPIGENLTMLTARIRRFDYGRVRLWGSLAFIAGAGGGGALLADGDPRAVPLMTIGAAVLVALACAGAPDVRTGSSGSSFAKGIGALLRQPVFLVFLATASLIQCSHAAYYAFVSLHWRAAGLDGLTIGALWAEAVVAEVVLFAVSGRLVRRAGVATLFAVAAFTGVIRWIVIAATGHLAALAVAQALHAGSFGLAHLSAMYFIQRAVPPQYSATAQGLYSAIAMGAVMALATMGAGVLYELSPAGAFGAMALACAFGGAGAVLLSRLRYRQPQ